MNFYMNLKALAVNKGRAYYIIYRTYLYRPYLN